LDVYVAAEMLDKEIEGKRIVYKTTHRGIRFLEAYFGKSRCSIASGKSNV